MTTFIAAKGLKNPHLQTLLPRLLRKQPLFSAEWQTLFTPDGDFLDLAWSEDWRTPHAQRKPLFVLFPRLRRQLQKPLRERLDARLCAARLALGNDAFSRLQW